MPDPGLTKRLSSDVCCVTGNVGGAANFVPIGRVQVAYMSELCLLGRGEEKDCIRPF
jgi:hypothetical protein